MTNALDAALAYAKVGLTVIPVPWGRKRPAVSWRRWQDQGPAEAELTRLFDGRPQNVAVICGRASHNLLILDCDDGLTFQETGRRLARLGIQTATVETVRGGHYWLRAPQAVRTAKRGRLDVKGQGSYALAPPSVHPTGLKYRFSNGAAIFTLPTLDVLGWLGLELAPSSPSIPRLAWRLLVGDPETLGRYPTRSEAEMAICCALANLDFDFWDCLRLFLANPAAGKFREMHERTPEKATKWLSLTWHKAQELVAANPSPAKMLAAKLQAWALSSPWPGRTGSSDRATYLAHLSIVQRCGRLEYQAGCRELAELAGLNWKTAAAANHRLVDAGLLEPTRRATATLANRFRLVDVTMLQDWYTPSMGSVRECTKVITSHDTFRRAGLGKAAGEVLMALRDKGEPATVSELSKTTGRHPHTVRKWLKGLFGLGMVEPVSRREWRVVPEFALSILDEAAKEIGVAGMGERQRERHRQERIGHRLALERE